MLLYLWRRPSGSTKCPQKRHLRNPTALVMCRPISPSSIPPAHLCTQEAQGTDQIWAYFARGLARARAKLAPNAGFCHQFGEEAKEPKQPLGRYGFIWILVPPPGVIEDLWHLGLESKRGACYVRTKRSGCDKTVQVTQVSHCSGVTPR